jgi:valyl-tRNA synthetase
MDARAFAADPQRVLSGQAEPFSILIPPPNVTARLHLGHALNNTLQDVLTRAHRMMGYEALWMPGTDHAGIATQAVVERRLRDEGTLKGPLKDAFTREEFVAKVQVWKDDYERQITDQLKLMGCSCDFDRQRFTMDEICAKAVREAFFRLFQDGLIYRGKRLVNWDPALQTAVADDECFEEEIDTSFWYLRYPLVHNGKPVTWSTLATRGYPGADQHPADEPAWVTVATTRPETYLADTAVAVNPHDPRAVALRGLSVQLPLVGRVIPIVEDAYVVLPEALARTEEEKNDPKAKFATGFLKVTPGHDKNDYELGQRHNLPIINMMSPDGRVSDKHGWSDVGSAHLFVGLTMPEARKKVVAEFKSHGLMESIKPYKQSQTFSDRSKAQVEPYLSDQWYVRVTDPRMAQSANAALVADQRSHQSPQRKQGGTEEGAPTAASNSSPASAAPRVSNAHGDAPLAGASGSEGNGDGSMTFFPARYAKTFEHWHDNIRDWCISRQLWWGHRIPVWTAVPSVNFGPSDPDAGNQQFEDFASNLSHQLFHLCEVFTQWDSIKQTIHVCARDARAESLLTALEYWLKTGADVSSLPSELQTGQCPMIAAQLAKDLAQFTHDPDVLDTWFSSALWPLSTMGWPEPEQAATAGLLRAYNPTSVLCTAREIITLWVSRMTMFNRYFTASPGPAGGGGGVIPFRHVYIHAVVQDGEGQKMSKSLGNGVDPLDIIETHGSDAMRFTLCQMATQTQDVRMPVDILDPHTGESFAAKMVQHGSARVAAPIQEHKGKKMVSSFGMASGQAKPTPEMPVAKNTSSRFDLGRNFANKMWNASRFTLAILDKAAESRQASTHAVSLPDQWILSRLAATTREISEALANYEFANYAQTLYRFVWDDFCDWYLESIKQTVGDNPQQQATLATALRGAISLAHPVMPFITEVIWEQLRERLPSLPAIDAVGFHESRKGDLLCTAGWPTPKAGTEDAAIDKAFARLKGLVTAIREVRAQHQILPKRRITLHVPVAHAAGWANLSTLIQTLAGIETIDGGGGTNQSSPTDHAAARVKFAFDGAEYAVSNLADGVDVGTERARLTKLIADKEKSIATMQARLANPGYAAKAPPAMVKQTQDQIAKDQGEVEAARATLVSLPV